MKNGFKILDSDMHLMEPVDLGTAISMQVQGHAPRGLTSDNVRDLRMAHPDGRYWGLPASHNRNTHDRATIQKKPGHLRSTMPSAAGPPKFSSKPWTSKASMSQCFIRPAG